jgi:hypothetical protein
MPNPLLGFHGNTEHIDIVDSYTNANNNKREIIVVFLTIIVVRQKSYKVTL